MNNFAGLDSHSRRRISFQDEDLHEGRQERDLIAASPARHSKHRVISSQSCRSIMKQNHVRPTCCRTSMQDASHMVFHCCKASAAFVRLAFKRQASCKRLKEDKRELDFFVTYNTGLDYQESFLSVLNGTWTTGSDTYTQT